MGWGRGWPQMPAPGAISHPPPPPPPPQGGRERRGRCPGRDITATPIQSRRFRARRERREGLAFGRELLQQWRGLEARIVGLLGIEGETIGDVLEADGV